MVFNSNLWIVMAEQNCSSSSPSTPVIITPTINQIKSENDDSNTPLNSYDSTNLTADKNNELNDKKESCSRESTHCTPKTLFSEPIITTSSDKRNGVKEIKDKALLNNSSQSFLRPSILNSGFSSNTSESSKASKAPFSLQCPKLGLSSTKFGNGSISSIFSSAVNTDNSEASSLSTESNNKINRNAPEEKLCISNSGMFSNKMNANCNAQINASPNTSFISVPNFVFGQNLHERVTESVKAGNHQSPTETKSNGASEMLFTSVLTSQEVKESMNNDCFGTNKESSSLIEDAARCQEARANKRKYEEVQITTGEEDEQNILQINCKLFAFDNGAWVERGRGILRLNDKKNDTYTTSRIVIRTLGNLRVVLNTKIWSQMSLNKASERSVRLTAMDPSGQVKIFLIRTTSKDMAALYSLLEERIKLSKDNDVENQASDTTNNEPSPEKKIFLKENEV